MKVKLNSNRNRAGFIEIGFLAAVVIINLVYATISCPPDPTNPIPVMTTKQ
jgi:hypothetical protein